METIPNHVRAEDPQHHKATNSPLPNKTRDLFLDYGNLVPSESSHLLDKIYQDSKLILLADNTIVLGFPSGSVGKESTCNARDPSSIPGQGRSAGEGMGYPLQYSWASLVAQLVKNLPAMRETWVRSLGWEDSPGGGKGYPLQYSGLENSMDSIVYGVAKSQIRLSNFHVLDFSGGSDGKESACNVGDWSLIPGSGRSPGEGDGNPLQYSCLPGESHGPRSLAGYSLLGRKESDTEQDFTFTFLRTSQR